MFKELAGGQAHAVPLICWIMCCVAFWTFPCASTAARVLVEKVFCVCVCLIVGILLEV